MATPNRLRSELTAREYSRTVERRTVLRSLAAFLGSDPLSSPQQRAPRAPVHLRAVRPSASNPETGWTWSELVQPTEVCPRSLDVGAFPGFLRLQPEISSSRS